MNILLAILLILNLSATIYFVGVLHERSQKLKRDMDAIAARLRTMEELNQVYQVSFDFRVRALWNKVFNGEDTGFNVEHLIKK